jgi:hypothetical protein
MHRLEVTTMNTADRNMIQQDVPPKNTAPQTPGKQTRSGPGFWPFILIGLGVLFLLENLGVRTWGVWNAVAVWWPLILIVIGANLITRPYNWGRQLTLALAALTALVMVFWSVARPTIVGGLRRETISQAITASRAEIQVSTGVTRLEIESNTNRALIEGRLDVRGNEHLERDISTRDNVQYVRLEGKPTNPNMIWPGTQVSGNATWNLRLPTGIPLVLRLNTGVGDARINLADLTVTAMWLNTGIGQTTVILPASGRVTASIESGIGETTVRIPGGMEARIRASSGLGTVRVNGSYQRDGDTYTSNGFATAANRADIQVKGGIGRVTVEPGR